MQNPKRHLFLLPALLIALVVAGCQTTAAVMPRLDDPTEILEETLRTTAELEFVHARVEARAEGGLIGGEPIVGTVEGDIDLGRRDFRALIEGNALVGGTGSVEVLLVGTELYTRVVPSAGATEPKWIQSKLGAGSDPRSGIPPNPAIAVALKGLLDHPSLTATLEGSEACGTVQCYHVDVAIAPELIGAAIGGDLFSPGDASAEPVNPAIPEVMLDIRIEEATRRIVSIATKVTIAGTTIDVVAAFSNHDVQVDLLAPAPDQVDETTEGSGLDGLFDGVLGGFIGD